MKTTINCFVPFADTNQAAAPASATAPPSTAMRSARILIAPAPPEPYGSIS